MGQNGEKREHVDRFNDTDQVTLYLNSYKLYFEKTSQGPQSCLDRQNSIDS